MTNNRPTLTIAVPCPTCEYVLWVATPSGMQPTKQHAPKCPDCTDGTIRQAVSCAGCLWAEHQGDFGDLVCLHDESHGLEVMESFGCLNWQAKT